MYRYLYVACFEWTEHGGHTRVQFSAKILILHRTSRLIKNF